jgi:hypothetical protein
MAGAVGFVQSCLITPLRRANDPDMLTVTNLSQPDCAAAAMKTVAGLIFG